MQEDLNTERLLLNPLSLNDFEFIFELVNTPNWLQFIGDKKVKTPLDAQTYIQNILNDTQKHYWVVKLKTSGIPIGIITFMKREYLAYYDIGFAFLPDYNQKGYAWEATRKVLDYLMNTSQYTHIQAITIPENLNSIRLLEKLGLTFEKNIPSNNEILSLYTLELNKI